MHPTLDAGSGINLIRVDAVPTNWTSFATKEQPTPKVVDAHFNPLRFIWNYNLIVDAGTINMVSTFHVVRNMAFPAILGTRFINQHVDAIYPARNKVCCEAAASPVSIYMPILAADTKPVNQCNVRLAQRTTPPAITDVITRANCDIPGLVLMTTISKLHQRHQVLQANRLASTQPGTPIQVLL